MSKGFLYDTGDELITRENAVPEVSSVDDGNVLTVVDGEWVSKRPDVAVSALLVIDVSAQENLRFTPYDLTGTAIDIGDFMKLADDNGIVCCRVVNSTTGTAKYAGNILEFCVKEASDTTKVDIVCPFVIYYKLVSDVPTIYIAPGTGAIYAVAKTGANFAYPDTVKLAFSA